MADVDTLYAQVGFSLELFGRRHDGLEEGAQSEISASSYHKTKKFLAGWRNQEMGSFF